MRRFSILVMLTSFSALQAAAANSFVYFGTYTGAKSKGIYVSRWNSAKGHLDTPRLAAELVRPSWVTVHPNRQFLYSVSELGNDGKTEGAITSFAINPANGELKMLNKVSTGGGGACHLAVNKAGKLIFAANYGSGSVAAFRLQSDGSIGERTALVQHQGSSVNASRQRGPHAHAVVLSADNHFLFVPDLGLDQVLTYRISPDTGALTPADPPFVKVKPGSGPRHFALHSSQKYAYGLNEMGSSVTAFAFDPAKGALSEIETASTLPPDFSGENNSAEIEVDRAGKFIYASNRGDDSIAVFAIDRNKGGVKHVQRVPTQGKTPRNFAMDPSGRYLLAANQNSDNVVVFRVDSKTGRLTPAGQTLEVGAPVCIQFLITK